MALQSDRWHPRRLLFLVGTPLVGLAIIATFIARRGGVDRPVDVLDVASYLLSLIIALAPYVIVGAFASAASRRGKLISWCSWLGGFSSILAMYMVGYLASQEAIQNRAWTGAALAEGMAVLYAIPASVVGSLIGWGIGSAISKRQLSKPEKKGGRVS
jgi:hypothetical protein